MAIDSPPHDVTLLLHAAEQPESAARLLARQGGPSNSAIAQHQQSGNSRRGR